MITKELFVRRDMNLATDKRVLGPEVTSGGKEGSLVAESGKVQPFRLKRLFTNNLFYHTSSLKLYIFDMTLAVG